MKFWVLTEVENKYIVNVIPYLGAIEKESRLGIPSAEHVVLSLTEVVKNKGYNVTTDNFFTSLEVARKLRDRATSIVGTVRGNSKHLSKEITLQEKGKRMNPNSIFKMKVNACLLIINAKLIKMFASYQQCIVLQQFRKVRRRNQQSLISIMLIK